MLPIYLGAYILLLIIFWVFFLVARQHTFKFKNMSSAIVPATNFLMFFLLVLSVYGAFLVVSIGLGDSKAVTIDVFNSGDSNMNTEYFY